jgi:hypothetical protein
MKKLCNKVLIGSKYINLLDSKESTLFLITPEEIKFALIKNGR